MRAACEPAGRTTCSEREATKHDDGREGGGEGRRVTMTRRSETPRDRAPPRDDGTRRDALGTRAASSRSCRCRGRDAFLVPLDFAHRCAPFARRSTRRCGRSRSVSSAQVLGAAWSFGLPELVLRRRAVAADRRRDAPRAHLRTVLDEPALTFATGLAVGRLVLHAGAAAVPPGRHAGRVRQDRLGRRHERAGARRVGGAAARGRRGAPSSSTRPRSLHAGPWEHLELCVTAPLPRRSKRVPSAQLPPVLALYEVAAARRSAGRVRTRAAHRRGGNARSPTRRRSRGRRPGSPTRSASRRRDRGRRARVRPLARRLGRPGTWPRPPTALYVWDWEYSRPDVPFGLDLLQFYFQEYFVARRAAAARSRSTERPRTPPTDFVASASTTDAQARAPPAAPPRAPRARRACGAARCRDRTRASATRRSPHCSDIPDGESAPWPARK